MTKSFASIGDAGFWCNDDLMEIWTYLLATEIETHPDHYPRLVVYAPHLRRQATLGAFAGWMHLELDDLDHAQRADLVAATHAVRQRIDAQPELLTPASLNSWQLGAGDVHFRKPVDAAYLQELARVFVALLEERWPHTVGDAEASDWYPPTATPW